MINHGSPTKEINKNNQLKPSTPGGHPDRGGKKEDKFDPGRGTGKIFKGCTVGLKKPP